MKRSLWALLLLGAGLSAGTPARAELDEVGLLNAEIQASACARYHQLFAAYDLEFLVPDLRTTVLERVGTQGASEAQLDRLERLYDAIRVDSAEAGLEASSRKAELNRGRLAVLQGQAEEVLAFCDRRRFSLHLLQSPRQQDGQGLDKATMDRLGQVIQQCGIDSALAKEYGFGQLFPNYRKVTMDNAERHEATDSQMEELARRFELGVVEGQNWPFEWELEQEWVEKSDEYRNQREAEFAESYKKCATETFHER